MWQQEGAWQPSASYLYTLCLDRAALAWEYIRRNPDYIADWHAQSANAPRGAGRWRLVALENPYLDAREAQPMWRPRPEAELCIVPLDDYVPGTLRFDLWVLPGRKILWHDGRRLLLDLQVGGNRIRMAIDTALDSGSHFGYVVAPGLSIADAASRFEMTIRKPAHMTRASGRAADRDAIVNMRTLQALDAVLAKVSQREVAVVVFGIDEVVSRWRPDGELRARTRHYIRRGRAFIAGGYQQLLYQSEKTR